MYHNYSLIRNHYFRRPLFFSLDYRNITNVTNNFSRGMASACPPARLVFRASNIQEIGQLAKAIFGKAV